MAYWAEWVACLLWLPLIAAHSPTNLHVQGNAVFDQGVNVTGDVYVEGNLAVTETLESKAYILIAHGNVSHSYVPLNAIRRYYSWDVDTNPYGFTVPTGSGSTVDHFHVPKTGYYLAIYKTGIASTANIMAWIEVNGGSADTDTHNVNQEHWGMIQAGNGRRLTTSAVLYLTPSDEVRTWFYSTGTVPENANVMSRPIIQMLYLGT